MIRAETLTPARVKARFAFQQVDAPVGEFAGWASTFGTLIESIEPTVMVRGCWKSIADDFRDVKILYQHDQKDVIGKPLELRETEYGLWIRAAITQATDRGREVTQLLKEKLLDALSVGFDVVDYYRQNGIRWVTAARCWECSVVTWGADHLARVVEAHRRPGFLQSQMRELEVEGARLEVERMTERLHSRKIVAEVNRKLRLLRLDALEHLR